MTLITDADLQGLSDMATELALTDIGHILREVTIDDGQGGVTRTYAEAFTAPCAVVDVLFKVVEPEIAGQVVGEERKMILFPRHTDIHGNDRIQVLVTVYRVIESIDPSTYEVLRRVMVWRQTLP